MSESDDEMPTLSAHALAALMQFKNEEEERTKLFETMYQAADDKFEERKQVSIDDFKEDWQLSQFWYNDETANILADELLDGADSETVICIVSAPSVFAAIRKRDPQTLPTKKIYLFEYDKRFELLAGTSHFGFYDYHNPFDFREDLKGKCHRLLIDPPFLEPECQTKSAQTAKALLVENKDERTKDGYLKYRFISCTGERMSEVIKHAYPDSHVTTFLPEHKNGLSNEFSCYASFEGKNWKFLNLD
ncbi:hypothetical protein CANARDRAFT_9834 [[Candida] arabinofermentans NRRL YB-2248]|uniref:Protein-lysine N-methyltransferase EFM5 n=1 Tax=[Candida] arabinofermentans NRRL YB-2248 TaxID=983967 RepID=A0A1E4SUT9_9ASCO|nr:hypothetical protein CANARDRAFT_9834 [[Candida] arabinofermentans NRRL YB-2248]